MEFEQRKQYILKQIEENNLVKISNLSKALNVTRETIRKDLYNLEDDGLLKVVRGGATKIAPNRETEYEKRKKQNVEGKKFIAKKAIKYIHNGDSIYIDYGTTTYEVARAIQISGFKDLTIVTNAIAVIDLLLRGSTYDIIVPGGNVRRSEESLSGALTLQNSETVFVNVGFFGAGGIEKDSGITNHYISEIEVSKKMIQHSQKSILVVDHTKFGMTALYKTANFEDVDCIITDKLVDHSIASAVNLAGTKLISPQS
ncbi:DeoR/GlpR family DNA-binding transcription regulator [Sporolactobacillus sp. KGMB 08714]|uniref:DeoR/GlpR family DNA-binding transcription regulator n=1 Tax=Sporolactobacillus sp. KGMB 08714 TaxID=3064704 RepID=UPI002FBE108C